MGKEGTWEIYVHRAASRWKFSFLKIFSILYTRNDLLIRRAKLIYKQLKQKLEHTSFDEKNFLWHLMWRLRQVHVRARARARACIRVLKIKRKTRGKNDTEGGIRLTRYARDSLAHLAYPRALPPPSAITTSVIPSRSRVTGLSIACVRTRQRGRHEIRLSTVSSTTTRLLSFKKLPDIPHRTCSRSPSFRSKSKIRVTDRFTKNSKNASRSRDRKLYRYQRSKSSDLRRKNR